MGAFAKPTDLKGAWRVFANMGLKEMEASKPHPSAEVQLDRNLEWLPNAEYLSSFKDCFKMTPLNLGGYIQLDLDDKNEATLYCNHAFRNGENFFQTGMSSYVLSSFKLSDNLAQKIRSTPHAAPVPNRSAVLAYPEGLRIAAKIDQGKKITWREVRILYELARAGESFAHKALSRPLSTLIGKRVEGRLNLSELVAARDVLEYVAAFWQKKEEAPHYLPDHWLPADMAPYVQEIYLAAEPEIANPEFRFYISGSDTWYSAGAQSVEKIKIAHTARGALRAASDVLYQFFLFNEQSSVSFFLQNLFQSPNPENAPLLKKFMAVYDHLPAPQKGVVKNFLGKEFNLDTAELSFQTYFNSCTVYAKMLAFVYRKTGRIDAYKRLTNQMLNELGTHETSALTVYLKELVIKDRDPRATLLLKQILLGGNKHLPKTARMLVLKEILSQDATHKILAPFLRGEEWIAMESGGKIVKKRFDMVFFARAELEPFYLFKLERSEKFMEVYGIPPESDWNDYENLIGLMMKRGYYSAVVSHLDAFYSDPERNPPPLWYRWERGTDRYTPLKKIFTEALKHKEMHDPLLGYVKSGNPFLGYDTIAYGIRYLDPPMEFMGRLKKMPLDSIGNRLAIEMETALPDGRSPHRGMFFPIIETAKKALYRGFEEAPQWIINTFQHSDLRVRHVVISEFAEQLVDDEERERAQAKYEGRKWEGPSHPQKTQEKIDAVRKELGNVDLTYLADLLSQAIVLRDRTGDDSIPIPIYNLDRFFIYMTHTYLNPTVSQTVQKLFENISALAQDCKQKYWEATTFGALKRILTTILTVWKNDYYQGTLTNDRELTQRGERGLSEMAVLLGVIAQQNNFVADMAIEALGEIAQESIMKDDVAKTLMTMAKSRGYPTLSALNALIWLEKSQKPEGKISRFLTTFDPRGLIRNACHPTAQSEWRFVLLSLIGLGNRNAYFAWRDYLIEAVEALGNRLEDSKSLTEFDAPEHWDIYDDAMQLAQMAAGGRGPEWLTKQMSKDIGGLFKNGGKEYLNWSFELLSQKADIDPILKGGIDLFDGDIGINLAMRMMGNKMKENENFMAWTTLIALGAIPRYSEMARFFMLNLPPDNPYYQTFAKYKPRWIAEHQERNRRTSEDVY